ncbi:phosphoribosyl-AMP cyclohydrolase [Oleiphilus sp. HI0067]|nr:phosphoribosyl-AMP cyclohydrolase [Oleiphilus sp. HI0067]KZY69334.1 phosphoribosyl-AMP cyclohydrolase [Oleiphilus sp. HI0067]
MATVIEELTFDEQGLIPVIAQDAETKSILMFAWMNRDALEETIATGRMCYWSRSRKSLWRKGESSGHAQQLKELRTDCDGDVLLAMIDQTGAACHTHRKSCFYLKFGEKEVEINTEF